MDMEKPSQEQHDAVFLLFLLSCIGYWRYDVKNILAGCLNTIRYVLLYKQIDDRHDTDVL